MLEIASSPGESWGWAREGDGNGNGEKVDLRYTLAIKRVTC